MRTTQYIEYRDSQGVVRTANRSTPRGALLLSRKLVKEGHEVIRAYSRSY